jgi:uncharacterized membrane protein
VSPLPSRPVPPPPALSRPRLSRLSRLRFAFFAPFHVFRDPKPLLLLAAALALLLGGLQRAATLDPYPDFVDFYPAETNEAGEYRFAAPQAALFWAEPLPAGARLTMRVQSPPPLPARELLVAQRGRELLRLPVGAEPRTVRLLLPPGDPALRGYALDLSAEAAEPPGDTRALGLLFAEVRLDAPAPYPPYPSYALAAALLAAVVALVLSFGLGWAAAGLAALLLALLFRADAGRFWLYAGALAAALAFVRLALPRPLMDRAERMRPWDPPAWAAAAVGLGFTAIIGGYALANHRLYGTNGYDLGLYDQTLWLISRFLPSYSTGAGLNMVGSHANLTLYPLAALYWLLPDVRALLLLQVAAVGLAAAPLYLIGRGRGQPWLGVALGAAYLAHPAVQNMALFDFHIDAFAATALLFALWAGEARRWRLMLVCCALVALSKENFAITVAWLGLWQLARRRWRLGAALVLGGAAWFLFATQILVPALVGSGESLHVSRFARYGDTLPAITLFALTNPLVVIGDMLWPGSGAYLLALLLPFAFLPLLSPYALLALPALAINLISAFEGQRSLLFHYNSLIVAVFAVAALDAACKLVGWADARLLRWPTPEPQRARGKVGAPGAGAAAPRPFAPGRASVLVLGLTALLLVAALLGQGRVELRRDMVASAAARDLGLAARRDYVLSLIPPAAAVSAQSEFHPHLSQRRQAFIYPNPFLPADFYNPDAMPFAPQIDYVVLDTRRVPQGTLPSEAQLALLGELEARGLYRRAAAIGGLMLLERAPGWPDSCYGPGWRGEECAP